jgi:hypothetical protein
VVVCWDLHKYLQCQIIGGQKKKVDLERQNIRKFRNVPVDIERPPHLTYQLWETKAQVQSKKYGKVSSNL